MSATATDADRLLESVARPCPPPAPWSGRLGTVVGNAALKYAAWGPTRRLARAATLIPKVRYYEQVYGKLDDPDLVRAANALRGRARAGEVGRPLIAEAFGLCSVAVWRVLGMRPYDVQLAAGGVMVEGACCELATGEGKTLTATFPVFLRALVGKGVHVATVNDYLARRDAELMGPVYERLGLSVGFLQQKMEDAERAAVYRKDVSYGTASEFGFDFLRDRLKMRGGQVARTPFWGPWLVRPGDPPPADPRVQRGHYFALVDEADSIFIDEARTPLIISAPTRDATPEEAVKYVWADNLARGMVQGDHFTVDTRKDKVELTDEGKTLARYSNPPSGPHAAAFDKLVEAVEKAVQAHHRYVLDHHYMILDGKVVIVDEATGRPMPDRQWRDGLHQAVEAKEGVTIHLAADHAAGITYQNYFRTYDILAGMSGTLIQNTKEIRKVYKTDVVAVPTNRPIVRTQGPDHVYPTEADKFAAIVAEVQRLVERGRPVLIGTRSVEKSETLSAALTAAGVQHLVLNAKQDKQEAQIVAQAGQPGRVTVATNMAGRGTDIQLGPGVAAAGGLCVIGTERHEALRVDRQLLGRAGRQGDPGSGQFFLCLADRILEALGPPKHRSLIAWGKRAAGRGECNHHRGLFRLAQRKTEKKHRRQRLDVMHHDKQRREMLADLGADPFVD